MEQLPWWGPALFGLLGVLVGSGLSLYGTSRATSRRFAHADREYRRKAYAQFINAATAANHAARRASSRLGGIGDERKLLADARHALLTGNLAEAQVESAGLGAEGRATGKAKQSQAAWDGFLEAVREAHARAMEVTLVGTKPLWTASERVLEGIINSSDPEHPADAAHLDFAEALADFIALARRDVGRSS